MSSEPVQDPKAAAGSSPEKPQTADTTLGAESPSAAPAPAPAPAPSQPAASAAPGPLGLPKGAFIAFRKSGGIKFTSQELLVYPDGRVTYGTGVDRNARSRLSRKLNDAQINRMRRMLDQSGFFTLRPPAGTQSPDSYAIEIVARVGQKHNSIEVFTGTTPDALAPLIDQLTKLLPADE